MKRFYIGQKVKAGPVTYETREQSEYLSKRNKPVGTNSAPRVKVPGTIIYVHPEYRFVIVEFRHGIRESFFPQEVIACRT